MTRAGIVAWIDRELDAAVSSVRANNELYAEALRRDGYQPDQIRIALQQREDWILAWRTKKFSEGLACFLDTAMVQAPGSVQ